MTIRLVYDDWRISVILALFQRRGHRIIRQSRLQLRYGRFSLVEGRDDGCALRSACALSDNMMAGVLETRGYMAIVQSRSKQKYSTYDEKWNHDNMVIQANRKNSINNGKTANTALSFSNLVPPRKLTAAKINVIECQLAVKVQTEAGNKPHTDQPNAPAQIGRRIHSILTKSATNAAMSSGKIQYPRTQSDCKKLLCNCRIILAPHKTIW